MQSIAKWKTLQDWGGEQEHLLHSGEKLERGNESVCVGGGEKWGRTGGKKEMLRTRINKNGSTDP